MLLSHNLRQDRATNDRPIAHDNPAPFTANEWCTHAPYPEGYVVPIPVSTKNPYPTGRVRVFMGKSMGSLKNTWGLPMPITKERVWLHGTMAENGLDMQEEYST